MTGAAMVYSPGYQLPLWLGRGQLRLWRRLDAVIGGQVFAATTVRELARALGMNPGSVSRDLDALQRLGLAVHDTTWGRAGVRLWRVVARGGRRGMDSAKRRRALARMGVMAVSPGQLTIQAVEPGAMGASPGGPPTVGSEVPPLPSARPSILVAAEDRHAYGHRDDVAAAPGAAPGGSTDAAPGPFTSVRCSCGRPRLAMEGRELEPCSHGTVPAPESAPDDSPHPEPTPAVSIACLDYSAHRHDHAYRDGRWICGRCAS